MNPELPLAQTEPEWSPVANKVAYTQLRGAGTPDPDPVVYDVDAGTVFGFLIGNLASDESPTWAPDGSRVIWTRRAAGGEQDLFIRPANGTGTEQSVTKLGDGVAYATPASAARRQAGQAAPGAAPAPVPAPPAGSEPEDTRPDPGTAKSATRSSAWTCRTGRPSRRSAGSACRSRRAAPASTRAR